MYTYIGLCVLSLKVSEYTFDPWGNSWHCCCPAQLVQETVRDQKIQSAAIAMQVLLPDLSEEKITTCLRDNHGDADRAWHQLQDIDRIDPMDATGARTTVCFYMLLFGIPQFCLVVAVLWFLSEEKQAAFKSLWSSKSAQESINSQLKFHDSQADGMCYILQVPIVITPPKM